MSYYDQQLQRASKLIRQGFFNNDPGGGVLFKIPREFALKDSTNNLHNTAVGSVEYFKNYGIPLWRGGEEGNGMPSSHTLSSQVACINHLFFIQGRQDVATNILRGIDENVKSALSLDNGTGKVGYVDFEVIGKKNYLGEKSHTRGANATSIDALMLAEMNNGTRKLFFIEWKYVERYNGKESKAIEKGGDTRMKIYLPLLKNSDCPIKVFDLNQKFIEGLFHEPFYQLMRQTLLANEMTKASEYGATNYIHLHLIPSLNNELRNTNPTKGKLQGTTLHEIWHNVLKEPNKYRVIDPKDFYATVRNISDVEPVIKYLETWYWD